MLNHHQRLVLTSPVVFEPAVMRSSITAGWRTVGDSLSHHHRHKSNAPRTVGDEGCWSSDTLDTTWVQSTLSLRFFPTSTVLPCASGNSAANQAWKAERDVETMAPLTMGKTCCYHLPLLESSNAVKSIIRPSCVLFVVLA